MEDLDQDNFTRFRVQMREPRGDGLRPERFRRGQVEGKTYQEVADILVQTFAGDAVSVTVGLLRTIHCNQAANDLEAANQRTSPAPRWERSRTPPPNFPSTTERYDLLQPAATWERSRTPPPHFLTTTDGTRWGRSRTPPSHLLPTSGAPVGVNGAAKQGHFVDRHRSALIERVSNMGPILDHLLQERVLQQEQYDRVMEIRHTQDQMRFLFRGPLKAGGDCSKDILMSALCTLEPFLMQDLWQKEG